ncbi:hypothetical protein [Eubacterium barkeri]|uniref:Uncharacterized protein n=1 Tax=Eubacterium barkeri TaxID=1528 RepID=A0A1H3IPI8_EUBBA|nr:hypothetical protein [Eubacterium barkeri]SDY29517.1 hypothetical protein SAMN04488579_12428 [Eubacterium barkeri]
MTNRQKIEYLQKYVQSKGAVDDIRLDIQEWEGRKDGLGAAHISDGARGSGESNIVEMAIQAIDDLINCYSCEILRLTDLTAEIETCIKSACKNRIEWRVMRLRYIHGVQWGVIEESVGLKKRQVQNIHTRIIDRLAAGEKTYLHIDG